MTIFSFNSFKSKDADLEKEYLRLIRENAGIISRICFYYAEDSEDYKDLKQDVYATLWESLDSFRRESSPGTWIYRVTLNTCISNFRKRSRRGKPIPLDSLLEIPDIPDEKPGELAAIYSFISRLNSAEKAILLLWLDNMSYDQIAEITGLLRNTVATKLRRIKLKLAEIAKKEE